MWFEVSRDETSIFKTLECRLWKIRAGPSWKSFPTPCTVGGITIGWNGKGAWLNGSQISQVSQQEGELHPVLSDWNGSFLTAREACLPKKLVFEQLCPCANPRCFPLFPDAEQERESSMNECWLNTVLHLPVRATAERRHTPFHWQCTVRLDSQAKDHYVM